MKLAMPFVFLLVAGISLSTQAQQVVKGGVSLEERELLERDLANELALIKSQADLARYIASSKGAATPLSALSPGGKQRFLQSLRFSDKGLASFDYRDIQSELTATQAYRLLALFGVERSTSTIRGLKLQTRADELIMLQNSPAMSLRMTDYPDKWCESRATCSFAVGKTCIGANC